jgi:phage-related protein
VRVSLRKQIVFLADSLKRVREFPEDVRVDMGRELARIQEGLEPIDWKPMPTVGRGVREIRVSDRAGEFRTLYLVRVGAAIYVLHAFQKKTQKTSQRDLELATQRYRSIFRSTHET